jgi:hypothetical protein
MNNEINIEALLLKLDNQLDVLQKQNLKEELVSRVNYFLLHDFNRVIQVLYRVDVNEAKLKNMLRENPDKDAAAIIADLLIRRQEEKIRTRGSFGPGTDATEEEKW